MTQNKCVTGDLIYLAPVTSVCLTFNERVLMKDNSELVNSDFKKWLDEYLSIDNWDVWFTADFNRPTFYEDARREFRRFFKREISLDDQITDKHIIACLFLEPNPPDPLDPDEKKIPGVHIHAVIRGIRLDKIDVLESMATRYFGDCKIMPMHDGVSTYIANKFKKYDLNEFDFDLMKLHPRRQRKIA